MSSQPQPPAPLDPIDAKHWGEVEDAVELIHDQQVVEAILALREVLGRSPKNPYAYHWLGVALFESAELEASRDAYRAALALSPRFLGARIHLSHVLRMLKDVRGALEQAEIARRQAPEDPDVWHALGIAHAQRGDKEVARRWLEAYLAKGTPEFEVQAEVRAILDQLGPPPRREDD
jgi:Flp pilus assembly protein TadD